MGELWFDMKYQCNYYLDLSTIDMSGYYGSPEVDCFFDFVQERWIHASLGEARLLLGLICLIPSTKWLDMLRLAHRGEIPHAKLLIDNSEAVHKRSAQAIADTDGLSEAALE
jgi:hypothetical protein